MVKEWLAKNDPETLKAQKSGLKSKVVSFNSFSKKYYFFSVRFAKWDSSDFFLMQKIFTLLMNSMTWWWDSNYRRTCIPQSSLPSSRFDKTDSTCKIVCETELLIELVKTWTTIISDHARNFPQLVINLSFDISILEENDLYLSLLFGLDTLLFEGIR